MQCYQPSGEFARYHTELANLITADLGQNQVEIILTITTDAICLNSERFCFDPPEPAFNGGVYTWNSALFSGSKTPYGTQVVYSCGLGRKLFKYTENDTIISTHQVLACAWDRTWHLETPGGYTSDFVLDECQGGDSIDIENLGIKMGTKLGRVLVQIQY